MKVGITGTREGMTEIQFKEITYLLTQLFVPGAEFHHGDCEGVDVEAAYVACELGYRIVCHPPALQYRQGFFGGDEIREPLGYLERDRNIVDEADVLLVVPLQNEWQPKGGTWFTHDYAKKKGVPLTVVWPGSAD